MSITTPTRPARYINPPDDDELWSYVVDDGKWFVTFSAISRICLGGALFFLGMRGDWLHLLLPFALMVVAGGVIGLVWSTQVPPFDRGYHQLTARRGSTAPQPIDVLIMTCGEDPDVVENTIIHATLLEHDAPIHVTVLDDGASDEIRRRAEMWGARYLTRPERGRMKKAGNLQYGYERTTSPLILVLDADFAVRSDFLTHTVPYFDDDTLGILQTPQFFRASPDNWVERGAAAQQEQFYRIGMRARNRHGGAICVGTNAVYRREALDQRGGMALLEHSEDIFTGMKVIDAGYRVAYLPLPLAAGTAPDSTRALASQQYRWARGNFALAGTPLFKRMKLTRMQRLGIWDGWIYYVTSALSPIVALFVPIVTLAEAPYAITLAPAVMVLPALFTEFVLQPRWLLMPDGRASRRVGLISQVAHFYAMRDHLTDRDQEWIPTGGERGSGSKQSTDRIPDLIAAGAAWGFGAIMVLVVARVMGGWSASDLAPVVLLAAIALPAALGTIKPAIEPIAPPELSTANAKGRDGFLDVVRAISITRVMFWHALGLWWISWTLAAMPAVFYVSGAVLAKSMQKRGCWDVVKSRLVRLIPPYVAFVAVSLTAVFIAVPDVASTHTRELLSWVIPYRSPAPLPWEAGWLSTPMWFLRALVLVLLLTPLLRPIGRRINNWVLLVMWAVALVAVDQMVARQTTETATAVVRGIGDIVCFGGFFAIGVVAHHQRYKWSRRVRLWVLAGLIVATAVVTYLAPPPDRVVNNSFALFGLVGLVWLVAMLAVEDHLRQLAAIPAIRRYVTWITDSAMSVYLWHTLAICFAYALIGPPNSIGEYIVLTAVFAVVLASVVSAVRPLEGLIGGRDRAPFKPLPIAAVVVGIALLVSQPTVFPVFEEVAGPPMPSGRPPVGGDDVSEPTETERQAMRASAEAWLGGNEVDAAAVVEIGAKTDERPITEQFGDPEALDPAAPFEVLSITKTMVAAAALQLVDEGKLTLDGPMPDIPGIEPAVTGQRTLRRLLSHATGIRDYRTVTEYRNDMVLTPVDAINLSLTESDLGSTKVNYAASNYLIAASVVETVTGQPLSEVLSQRFFVPLGMHDTRVVNNTREGFVGQGSGGVVSTLADLAHWYDALIRRGTVLSAEMRNAMIWGGIVYSEGAGLGAWRHCPCQPASVNDPEPFLYVFHDGGDVRVVYIPDRDVVIAMRFTRPLYDERQIVNGIDDFVFAVADRRSLNPLAR